MTRPQRQGNWTGAGGRFGLGGRLFAMLAVSFMCLATFHSAAHFHEDDDHEGRQDCAAFHLVAQTPFSPPADIVAKAESSSIPAELLSQQTIILVDHDRDQQVLPRGPPLQSVTT